MKWLVFNFGTLFLVFNFSLSCNKQPTTVTSQPISDMPAVTNTLQYLALGDSYTIGQNVAATERFPFLTVSMLRAQNLSFADPKYIATTGWTTADLLKAISNETNLGTYDVVSLLIGVNDQYQHLDTAGYRVRFTTLLEKAIALTGDKRARVFVLSIPDYSATPFVADNDKARIYNEINLFNAINKELALQHNVGYIDITSLTRDVLSDASLLTDDELHYSAAEHHKWANLLAPAIRKALE